LIGEFETGLTVVDVVSIGAGGGSIGWVDKRGVPQVGPISAGSMPGPACYGQGGTEPTLTDAAVVLGLLDPDRYLRGRVQIDPQASRDAIDRVFQDQFAWPAEKSADAIFELAAANMAHALRQVSVQRGHDPRNFAFLAFGGTLPLIVTRICEKLGLNRAIIPHNSSVFCAYGVLTADYMRTYVRTVEWNLMRTSDPTVVEDVRRQMIEQARSEFMSGGINWESADVSWEADCRFQGQVYEVRLPMEDRDLRPDDAESIATTFLEAYESEYGIGTAWKGSDVVLINVVLSVRANRHKPELRDHGEGLVPIDAAPNSSRPAWLRGALGVSEVGIFDELHLLPGSRVHGPAIIDCGDTTIAIPDQWSATRDEYLNFRMSLSSPTEGAS
jgi:N-methylhydantoinase A